MKKILLRGLFFMSGLFSILLFTSFFSGMLLAGNTSGQNIREVKVSLDFEEASLSQVFTAIEEATEFDFLMDPGIDRRPDKFTLQVREKSVAFVLEKVSTQTGLSFRQLNGTILVHIPQPVIVPEKEENSSRIDRVIKGRVTDENGEPLPGASILIKGTVQGTVTDIEGNYVLEVPDEEIILSISFVGYSTKEIVLGDQSIIDIVLTQDVKSLQEVVVSTGYWQTTKELSTSNIAKLDAKDIEQQPISNPLQAIQGRLTGVDVVQQSGVPGSGFNIQIRGQNSLRNRRDDNGNNPLILIDGVPYPIETLDQIAGNTNFLNFGGINPLNYINPNDIESIEILKDADATAIYGSRGANGVILITTKKGKAGKTTVSINSYTGFGELAEKQKVMNLEQYLMMRNEAFSNDNREPGVIDHDVNGNWNQSRETNWQDELLSGTSTMSNLQASVSGGTGQTNFLIGVNYLKETTIFSDDFFDRKISALYNITHSSLNNRLTATFSGSYTVNDNNLFTSNLAADAVTLAPNAPELLNENGELNWENGSFENPLAAFEITNNSRTYNFIGNVDVGYEIWNGLSFNTTLGYTDLKTAQINTIPTTASSPFAPEPARANFADASVNTWIVEPTLSYNREVGSGNISFLIGGTFQQTDTERQRIDASNFSSDALLQNPAAAGDIITQFDNSEYRFNSVFGRVNYNYDDRYIVNLTSRRDGSSRFGPGRRFANFFAIGTAYIFSNETVIKDNFPFLSFGKLRASYGTTGSDFIGNYEYLELWSPNGLEYDGVNGISPQNLFNQDFAWEETRKLELGLDLKAFDDRVSLLISYYRHMSDNQLIGLPLPLVTGFSIIQSNFPALVRNTGLEIELSTINLTKGDFRWTTSFNITIPKNELVEFDNIENTSFANDYVVGEPITSRRVYNFLGVDAETGLATFQDVDGNGRLDSEDFTVIIDLQDKYRGGLQNTIEFKNISLGFLFRFENQTGTNYIADAGSGAGSFRNQSSEFLGRWQQPGDQTPIQRFTQTGTGLSSFSNLTVSDLAYSDASFIRLQNVSISYQFPQSILNKMNFKGLRVYIQGQNLVTFTNYLGWDPETQSSLALPPLRVITYGLNITL